MNNDYENQDNNVIGDNKDNTEATKEDISLEPLFAEPKDTDSMPVFDADAEITEENYDEIISRMDQYMTEFQRSGIQNLILEE